MNRGEIVPVDMPRARIAHYDRIKGIFVIDLIDGRDLMFPVRMWPGLSRLTDDEVEFFEIIHDGSAIRWERWDVEISIPDFARSVHASDNEFARMFADEP